MMFKGVDFWPHASLFPIIGLRRYFIIASALAILSSIVLVATQGLNFGIDFKGGSLIEVQAKSGSVDIPGLRTKLGGLGLGDVQIQSLGASGNEALIRVEQQPGGEKA
ncbi:MAG: protein translocase subunit SecF, partial [Hyphomicrobiaceae bacterium]